MAILLTCPSCARQLRVPDDLLGRLVKCPSCQTTFTAQDQGPPPAAINERGEIERRDAPEQPEPPRPARPRDEGYDDEPGRVTDQPGSPRREDERGRNRYDDDPHDGPRPVRRADRYRYEDEDYPRFDNRTAARSAVAGPGIALMIVGILAICLSALSLVLNVVVGVGGPGAQPARTEEERMMNLASGVCGALLGMLWGGLVSLGGYKMRNLQSYGLAMTASIVAMLPCNGCCILGLPFGIWGLVALNRPDVKDAFR